MITVSKEELLGKLKANRDKHVADFKAATTAFIHTSIDELNAYYVKAKLEDIIPNHISFDRPVSHEDDYNTVIEMLEMSVDTEVVISMFEFKSFVQDQWAWKQAFLMNATKYLGK